MNSCFGENSCKCFKWASTAANASSGPVQLQMLQVGQYSCKCFKWASTAANASSGPVQLQMLQVGQYSCKCFKWASTAANASSGPVQLQMLQVGQYSCKCFKWASTAANASSGPVQLQMLQVGQYSCKCFKWASTAANASSGPVQLQMLQLQKQAEHCIIKRRVIYTKLRTHKVKSARNSQSEKQDSIASSREGIFLHHATVQRTAAKTRAASRHVGQCNAHGASLLCSTVQYSASTVQFAFLNERTGLHRKSFFFKDECLTLMLVLSVKMMLSPRSCKYTHRQTF